MNTISKCFLLTATLTASSFHCGWATMKMPLSKQESNLITTVEKGDAKTASNLLAKGNININDTNTWGETALIIASRWGFTEIVRMLLDAGADVDIQAYYGDTALMVAAEQGRGEIVRMLLRAEADITLKNKDGKKASDMARESSLWNQNNGHDEVLKILEKHQKDVQDARDLLAQEWDDCPLEVIEHCIMPFGIKLERPDQK